VSEPLIVRATADEIAAFAAKRWSDEHGQRLYVDLAEVAPNGAWVAKDEATPIGIAMAHALDDEWFLSDLYVEPGHRLHGIGWKLLTEAARDAGDVVRSGLLVPGDVGGLAFFLRRGLMLQTPVLRVAGAIPREDDLLRLAASDYRFGVRDLDPVAHGPALDALDREVRGSARRADHAYIASRSTGTAFFLHDEFVGYTYVWPSGRIGPVAAVSGAYIGQLFAFALAALAHTYGASWCTTLIPGTNVRAIRAAMGAGLTIEGVRIFASDGGLHDLTRYIGFHGLLF
jgi:GNAT superfamily N-acetyltransferase